MKKFFTLSLLILIGLISFGCNDQKLDYKDVNHIESISEIINNKENQELYIYRIDCPFCEQLKPDILKYGYNNANIAFILSSDKIKEELLELLDVTLTYVPSIIVIENGLLAEGPLYGVNTIKEFILH